MAEERNVGLARAPEAEPPDTDATKEELQRRMEQARESITQTVTEIKDTVSTQYQQVRETISDSLDWREQYRRRPLAFSAGAAGLGLILGYSIAGAFKSDDVDDVREELYDEADAYDVDEGGVLSAASRSYAAQPILGGHEYASSAYAAPGAPPPSPAMYSAGAAGSSGDVGPGSRPSYSSGYDASSAAASGAETQEPSGPGLIERFKGTKAFDRLQDELSTLGERAIEELSKTAQTVVVPALLGKLKDLIGIDLSMQREVAQRSKLEHETARAGAATAEAANQS